MDPKKSSTIYAATGHGIVKSANGGASWTGSSAGLTDSFATKLVIDPVNPSTLYALASNTIFKSTNGGGSWNVIARDLPPNTSINSLVVHPTTSGTVYIATGSGLFTSADGGLSWNGRHAGLPSNFSIQSLAIAPTSPSIVYAVGLLPNPSPAVFSPPFSPGGFKSADGGQSWSAMPLDSIQSTFPIFVMYDLAVAPEHPGTLYAFAAEFRENGDNFYERFKSTDGGATWSLINTGLPSNVPDGPGGCCLGTSLAIDPAAPSTIYAGYVYLNGSQGVSAFKSRDEGQHWDAAAAGLASVSVSALAIDPINLATVYAGVGDAIFKSVDGGGRWVELTRFPSPFAQSRRIGFLAIDFTNPQTLYAGTTGFLGCGTEVASLFKSTDGGASWSDGISSLPGGKCSFAGPVAMDPSDPATLYIGESGFDSDPALDKSTDGGTTWESVWGWTNGLSASLNALVIDPSNPSTLYAGSDESYVTPASGGMFKSTDSGANWTAAGLTNSSIGAIAIDRANPSILYAAANGVNSEPRGFRGLFKSADAGVSWSPIDNGLTELLDTRSPVTALLIDPANSEIVYAAAAGGGVFRSIDGGANWSSFNDALGNLNVRVLVIASGALYAGTDGGAFKIVEVEK